MKRLLKYNELYIRILNIIGNLNTDTQKVRAIKHLIYEQIDLQYKELKDGNKK